MHRVTRGRWVPMIVAGAMAGCADGVVEPRAVTPPTADVAAAAAARCEILVTDLGTLGGAGSIAYDVNRFGVIVGESGTADGATHAFRWADGQMTDLGTLGGATSIARAINDRGQIVGESETAGGETHAFLWQDGVMTDLGAVHAGLQRPSVVAYDITHRGQITGTIGTHGFVLDGGTLTEILDERWREILPRAIDDRGAVAGIVVAGPPDRGFVWRATTGFQLVGLGGAHAGAEDLNRHGDVVGWSEIPTDLEANHAFLHRDGVTIDLDALLGVPSPGPGVSSSIALGINQFGQVVGAAATLPRATTGTAYLWWRGRTTILDPLPGYADAGAEAIGDQGHIVGQSTGGAGPRATLWTLSTPHSPRCWGDQRSGGAVLAGDPGSGG